MMKIRSTRRGAVLGGTTLAVVLGAASVAAACIPGAEPNMTKFEVKDKTGTTVVRSATKGTELRAVGKTIDKPAWPYQIKLLVDAYTSSNTGRCGYEGIPQVVAQTTPWISQYNVPPQRFSGSFDMPFVLNPGVDVGDAHFCAIPNWNKDFSTVYPIEALEYYVFSPFTVV